MDQLPLRRNDDGEIQLEGIGAVTLQIIYESVLGTGAQAVVFAGKIFQKTDSQLVMQVAAKVLEWHNTLSVSSAHSQAWLQLNHVLRPFGFLAAHDQTGTPSALVMEIGMPLDAFLAQAGPLAIRHIPRTKAITRALFQFTVSADGFNLLHMDIKMANMFVVQSHSLELVKLAVGDFGSSQRGEERISAIFSGMVAPVDVPFRNVLLDSQLCFYDELYGWARIAVPALVDRFPPDRMSAPTAEDYAMVPQLGQGNVLDAVHHLMHFALDMLTTGKIEEDEDAEYITSLDWYDSLPEFLAG